MADKDEQLAQFQSITGCDAERAQFYLESSNWQLDLAMASFYEGDADQGMDLGAPPASDPAPAAATGGGGQPPAQGRINIMGGGGEEDSDSEEEDGQAFFAGGSTNSGTNILGPKKKKANNVGDFFKAFKDAGAVPVDPSERGESSKAGTKAFSGGGFKLGSDESPSQAVGVSGAGAAKPAGPRTFVLKMWKEGFSLDDGDMRRYDDPKHRGFLAAVMKGQIPDELVKEAKGGEVNVDMEDHRDEEFQKAKVKAKPFGGAGNVLGSIAPSVAAPEASASLDPAAAEKSAQAAVSLSEASPVASIQVRLADGSRLIVKLNHSHTVSDLRTYITTARPQYAGVAYSLMTTFPNKEITEDAATISGAGLVGAAVLQRLK